MKTLIKILITVALLILLFGCSAEYEQAATIAPREPAHVNEPEPVRPEPEPDIPNAYGDDPFFDDLWDRCEADEFDACEDLYWESPFGSEYEAYADERIEELTDPATDRDFVESIGADIVLDLTWTTLTAKEQNDLCDGVRLLGADYSGYALSAGSSGLVTAEEASAWLEDRCL